MKKVLVAALMLLCVAPALADEIVYQAALAGQGVWFNHQALPSDFEAGVTGSASLSPHISAVGAALFGFEHSYVVGTAGLRFTVTDAENQDFGIGVGLERRFSSEPLVRSEEWIGRVAAGWRPWPTSPRVSLIASADYGFDTDAASVAAGLRYKFTREY